MICVGVNLENTFSPEMLMVEQSAYTIQGKHLKNFFERKYLAGYELSSGGLKNDPKLSFHKGRRRKSFSLGGHC